MGTIRETLSILRSILTSRWYWIIVISASSIIITPFLIIILIISLPTPFNLLATIGIIIAWGIVGGYKDWIIAKAKEEKQKIKT